MYACPNCGGNLKFDVSTQNLSCEYCGTTADPYAMEKETDAEVHEEYDATVFRCPNCGGEIISSDNTAAAFCSFCGASTILDAHLKKEKRPRYIIPFTKTKEDCKQAYADMMKMAIFAPNYVKDSKYIDGFRGIYMPYWLYRTKQTGTAQVKADKTYIIGDYRHIETYSLSCDVDANYNGYSHDASTSFTDNISESIAPYDITKLKDFSPTYLSGFYADTADVDSSLYVNDAIEFARESTKNKIINDIPDFNDFSISTTDVKDDQVTTTCEGIDSAMLPVWFLSYKNGNRVAYATVNGQTGKVSCDIPVDKNKYLIGSGILALIIFILLNMFFVLKPKTVTIISLICAVIALFINRTEISDLKENMEWEKLHSKDKFPGWLPALVSIVISAITIFVDPVSDMIFYGASIISFIGVVLAILDIMNKHNILSTHPLPQFERTGGDDLA